MQLTSVLAGALTVLGAGYLAIIIYLLTRTDRRLEQLADRIDTGLADIGGRVDALGTRVEAGTEATNAVGQEVVRLGERVGLLEARS